jgi:uncharacterized protein (TIGR03437 family)
VSFRSAFSLILAAVATAYAQTSGAIPASFFGISALGGSYPVPSVGALAHPEFAWAQLEPAYGTFDFSLLDDYVAAAQQHGLMDPATNTASIAFTLSAGTPSWAVGDQTNCSATVCTVPPDNLQHWKDFVTALVQHYNGTAKPHIHYYELWNEANNGAYWTGTNAQMLALAKATYPIIHQDRYSLLLTPSVAGAKQAAWMTAYLQAGASPYSDGAAFHGYLAASGSNGLPMPEQDTTPGCQACYGSIVTIATQLRAALDNWGMAGKPLLETEGSWGAATLDGSAQTAWMSRYMLLLAGLRASLNLQMVGWYAWSGGGNGWGNLADGSLQPTRAGAAYSQLYNWLVGATITKPCSSVADGTWTCSFTRPGGYVARAVWNTQGYINYTAGLSYTQYRDLTGKTTAIAPDAFIDVSPVPVLIEGSAPGTGYAPVISLIANAEGETPIIAPNMWVEIKGINLARAGDSRIWQGTDFSGNQMPRQMDGVSVTVNGKGAYLYYISPTQVNILTPPDAMSGNIPVQVTVNGIASPVVMVRAQAIAPSFFVFGGGPYLAAEHSTGKYLGPATLYPGLTTPAKPGEIIVLYANGFGPTSTPVQPGLPVQFGELTTMPSIQIGGVNAQVVYAGLVGPGEFQFNVVVPNSLSAGDQSVQATYNGFSTQPGVLISVQP